MLVRARTISGALCLLLSAVAGAAEVGEATYDLSSPSQVYARNAGVILLAANDSSAMNKETPAAVKPPKQEFEPPLFSASNAHLALGFSTIAAALATAMTAPEEACEHGCTGVQPPRDVNGTHATLAKATVALAAATIASGVLAHWNDFHLEDGFTDPDNLHVLLGVTGAAMMAYAVNKSANSSTEVSHAGVAEMGALGMAVAIKLTW